MSLYIKEKKVKNFNLKIQYGINNDNEEFGACYNCDAMFITIKGTLNHFEKEICLKY